MAGKGSMHWGGTGALGRNGARRGWRRAGVLAAARIRHRHGRIRLPRPWIHCPQRPPPPISQSASRCAVAERQPFIEPVEIPTASGARADEREAFWGRRTRPARWCRRTCYCRGVDGCRQDLGGWRARMKAEQPAWATEVRQLGAKRSGQEESGGRVERAATGRSMDGRRAVTGRRLATRRSTAGRAHGSREAHCG